MAELNYQQHQQANRSNIHYWGTSQQQPQILLLTHILSLALPNTRMHRMYDKLTWQTEWLTWHNRDCHCLGHFSFFLHRFFFNSPSAQHNNNNNVETQQQEYHFILLEFHTVIKVTPQQCPVLTSVIAHCSPHHNSLLYSIALCFV